MRSQSSKRVALACAVICLAGRLAPAWGQEVPPPSPPGISSIPGAGKASVEIGGEVRSVSGDHNSKFEQHREVPRGAILKSFDIRLENPNRPYRLDLLGFDLTQRDQKASAALNWYGRAKLRFVWDQLPNFSARGVTSVLNAVGPNSYRVSDPIRQALETASDANLSPIVRNLLSSTPRSDLRSQRNTGSFAVTLTPTPNWELRFNLERQIRSGQRALAIGTNNIIATAAGDLFQNLGQEMGEPLNHRTTTVGVGSSYHHRRWLLNVDYVSTFFENRQLGLQWDNPFRLTDVAAVPPSGGTGRGRFARGQLALPPDNRAHQITLSGFVWLPRRSKFSGLVSLGLGKQNEAFLPFTLNTAIVGTNLPPGVTPTQLSALPAPSLKGDVRTIHQDYVLTSRTLQKLTLTFHYLTYDYDNRTLDIRFPGYASFSDSFWKTSVVSDPIESVPISFFRQRASGEALLRPWSGLRLTGDYTWEGWNRTNREATRTNEHTLGGHVVLEPKRAKWFDARIDYHYGDRIPLDYTPHYQEFSLLRMFDQARRIRHDANAIVEFRPSNRVSASLNAQYLADRYDRNFFGLHNYLQGQFGADFSYSTGESSNLYFSTSADRVRSDVSIVARSGGTLPFRLPKVQNTWLRDTRDRVDSFSFGWNRATHNDRLRYDISYGFAFSRNDIHTANPFTLDPDAVNNAQAFPFPEIKDSFHELRTSLEIKLRENLSLGLTYLFQPYRLNDFMTDILDPWIPDRLAPENDPRRYLFLNARDGNYAGHAASITLRYSFH